MIVFNFSAVREYVQLGFDTFQTYRHMHTS